MRRFTAGCWPAAGWAGAASGSFLMAESLMLITFFGWLAAAGSPHLSFFCWPRAGGWAVRGPGGGCGGAGAGRRRRRRRPLLATAGTAGMRVVGPGSIGGFDER